MNDKVNFALVGVFVLSLGGALIGFSLWLGFAGEARHYNQYVAYFKESVSGLNVKASVKYRGVDVGRVKAIMLDHEDPTRVRVVLEIETGTPIKTDTVAILSSQGLTGIAHVELSGGSQGSDLAGGDSRKPTEIRTGPSLFVRLDTAVSSLLDEMRSASGHLNTVAGRINESLASNNIKAAQEALENIRNLTESLASHADGLSTAVANVNRMSGDAANMSAELPQLVAQVRLTLAAFDSTAKAIGSTADAIGDTATTLSTLALDVRSDIRNVAKDTFPEVSAVLSEVRQLAQTLNRLGQELERDPSLLIRGRSGTVLGPGE